jgi:hypothetical protein
MIRAFVLAALLLGMLAGPAAALERKPLKDVDLGAFSQDGQAQPDGEQDFAMFWWIPVEFREASVAKQGGTAGDASIIKALRPYILVGVVRAKISPLGVQFLEREQIRGGLRVWIRSRAP